MVKKTRNYIKEINLKSVNFLLDLAVENGVEIEEYQGVLMDNYILYDAEELKFRINKRTIKPRKYIVIREKYLNSWSSISELIMTNDDTLIDKYKINFEEVL